jgi:hypothetical protein
MKLTPIRSVVRSRPAARATAAIIAGTTLPFLVAACSGSPASIDTSGSPNGKASTTTRLLAVAHCMRSNGVPTFPDPNSAGEFPKSALEQLATSNPRYHAASNTCAHLMPSSLGVSTAAQNREIANDEAKFATCMRSHGVPNWPDPVLDQGRLVFDPQGAGIDTTKPQISGTMQSCDHVFPASIGVPPGAGHNP